MKELIQKCTEYHIPCYTALIDYSKAFDSIEWIALWTALDVQGVHTDLIKLLQRFYHQSTTTVSVNGQRVPISIRRGVKQGDPISPRLFTSVLRLILNDCDWQEDGISIDGCQLTTLAYADDIVVVAQSRPALTRMLLMLKETSSRYGLSLNPAKTVVLSNCSSTRAPIDLHGEPIHFVNETSYLGTTISFPLNPSRG